MNLNNQLVSDDPIESNWSKVRGLHFLENVRIDGMNVGANVKVYKYGAPRYIPAVM
jgi:hypothetical protein